MRRITRHSAPRIIFVLVYLDYGEKDTANQRQRARAFRQEGRRLSHPKRHDIAGAHHRSSARLHGKAAGQVKTIQALAPFIILIALYLVGAELIWLYDIERGERPRIRVVG